MIVTTENLIQIALVLVGAIIGVITALNGRKGNIVLGVLRWIRLFRAEKGSI